MKSKKKRFALIYKYFNHDINKFIIVAHCFILVFTHMNAWMIEKN